MVPGSHTLGQDHAGGPNRLRLGPPRVPQRARSQNAPKVVLRNREGLLTEAPHPRERQILTGPAIRRKPPVALTDRALPERRRPLGGP